MPEAMKYIVVLLLAYLLGSLNFSIIVSKCLLKRDIRDYGSGNAGSTNAYRVMGGAKTLLVMLGDIGKGIAGALIAGAWFGELGAYGGLATLVAGVAVVLGHMFPVYFGFRGGKGVLTMAAAVGVFDLRVLAISLAVFLVVVLISRYVSLGSIAAMIAFPIVVWCFYPGNLWYLLVALILSAAVIFLHRGNIKRLLAHNENKFSFHRGEKRNGGQVE